MPSENLERLSCTHFTSDSMVDQFASIGQTHGFGNARHTVFVHDEQKVKSGRSQIRVVRAAQLERIGADLQIQFEVTLTKIEGMCDRSESNQAGFTDV